MGNPMFFVAMAALILFIWIITMDEPTGHTGKKEKTWCPPHKWEYKKDKDGVERLFCNICGGKPEYVSR